MSNIVPKNPRDCIFSAVRTEKSVSQLDAGRYTFTVSKFAAKPEIKRSIEQAFGVKVLKINTINRPGKRVRTRFGVGKRADTKRAIVTLKGGVIDFFAEGQ